MMTFLCKMKREKNMKERKKNQKQLGCMASMPENDVTANSYQH